VRLEAFKMECAISQNADYQHILKYELSVFAAKWPNFIGVLACRVH
jgi:hypothetical protein